MAMTVIWRTPDGEIEAEIYERYIGLRGQQRVGLVDKHGRVFHYDLAEIMRCGTVLIYRNYSPDVFDVDKIAAQIEVHRG